MSTLFKDYSNEYIWKGINILHKYIVMWLKCSKKAVMLTWFDKSTDKAWNLAM